MATGACLIMARSCGSSGSFCNGTCKAPNVQAADTARYYRNLDLDQMGWLSDQPDPTVNERPEMGSLAPLRPTARRQLGADTGRSLDHRQTATFGSSCGSRPALPDESIVPTGFLH